MQEVKHVVDRRLTERGVGYEPEGDGVSDSPRP